MDLAAHPDRWPFTLEKWYVDAVAPDGTVLLVYVGRLRGLGVGTARVTADLFRPGLRAIRGDAPGSRWRGGEDWLDAGAARIVGDALSFVTPGLCGELTFTPRHPPARLGDPFLARGNRRLEWTVEIPDADVRGLVRWPGGELAIAGRGYRDRVFFDLLPWTFPIRELAWGRVAAGEHASTWAIAATDHGEVSAGWADGRPVAARDARPPSLATDRVLVESAVVDLPGLRLGLLRGLLRRLTRDPREIKWAALARIDEHEGVALHERVRWS